MNRPRPPPWLWRSMAAAALGHVASSAHAETQVGPPDPDPASTSGQMLAQEGYKAMAAGDLAVAAQRLLQAIESGALSPEQRRGVVLDLSDALMSLGHGREAAQALELLKNDAGFDVQSRRAFALDAAKDRRGAYDGYAAAVAAAATPGQRTAMRRGQIYAAAALEDRTLIPPLLSALRGDPNLSRADAVNIAYIALTVGDDAAASGFFAMADHLQPLDGSAALDAGYAAKRLREDDLAVRYFRQGLASAVFAAPAEREPIRREISDLSRRWGVSTSLIYDNGDTRAGRLPGAGQGSLQVGGEVYYRPLGWNGGQPVEVFARAFQTLDAKSGDASGAETTQGWVGVRAKPLASQNLILEASRLVKLGAQSRNDWMARASYSSTRGLEISDDDRAQMFHVFADGARLFRTNQTIALADARVGRSYRYDGGKLIVAPFAGAALSYDSALAQSTAFSVGPGLWLRRWFREEAFLAPQSYVDLSLQYRLRLAGDRRGQGLFVSFSVTY